MSTTALDLLGYKSADDLTAILGQILEISKGRKTVWGTPIPWNARPVFKQGVVQAPNYGSANQVIIPLGDGTAGDAYIVPRGMKALLCGLVLGYAGGSAPLPGQILFTVDVDNPNAVPTPGIGYTEKDYSLVPFTLGDFVGGPVWPVEFRHDEFEQVRIKAQTVSGVTVGLGTFVFGALIGFQWPAMGWEG